MFFLPKKSKIFDELVKQSSIIEQSAQVFDKIANNWKYLKKGCDELESLEKRGDECVHRITDEIEKSFVLPLDKEDVKELTDSLDDIIDNLEQTANRLTIYKMPGTENALKDFSGIIVQSVGQIHKNILLIQKHQIFSDDYAYIYKSLHDLENKGDSLHRRVLEKLMGKKAGGAQVVFLGIKWKEIYQTLEDTLDRCEDIAIIFERLRIKYR